MLRVVLDTDVLRAAVCSVKGASSHVLQRLPDRRVTLLLSVRLYFEYQDVLTRLENLPPGVSAPRMLHFSGALRGRPSSKPWLSGPGDDMVLELALNGSATHLVTFNKRHIEGVEDSCGKVVTPADFLACLRQTP